MRIALATCDSVPDWEVDDRPLHQAFGARGVEIVQASWTDAFVDWASFDACLIRTTWDYTEDRDAYVDWAVRAAQATLLMNGADVVRWNTHKSYLRVLEDRGVPTVPTLWLAAGSRVDLNVAMTERGWERGFIKPLVGATARETLRFNRDPEGLDQAQAHVDRLLPIEDLMVQSYMASVETFGEVSALFIDGRYSHGVRKVPVPGDYRVQDDWGATDEPYTFSDHEIGQLAEMLQGVDADLVYARCDLLRDPEGTLRLIELELVEPSLFFRHGSGAAEMLADAVIRRASASSAARGSRT